MITFSQVISHRHCSMFLSASFSITYITCFSYISSYPIFCDPSHQHAIQSWHPRGNICSNQRRQQHPKGSFKYLSWIVKLSQRQQRVHETQGAQKTWPEERSLNMLLISDHQKHSIRVPENDSRTLTEELVHQHELRMSNSPLAVKMRKLYYDHQRSLYQLDESPIKKLKTIDNAQLDIPGLSAALAPACKVPKNCDPIIQWMRRGQLIKQRALVHIIQASLRNSAILGLTQQIYAMEVLKFIARNDLHKNILISETYANSTSVTHSSSRMNSKEGFC